LGTQSLDTLRNNTTFAQQQAALYANNPTTLRAFWTRHSAESFMSHSRRSSTAPPPRNSLPRQPRMYMHRKLGIIKRSSNSLYSYVTLSASPQHLLSRGSVHINSSNASLPPIINLKFFSVPYDIELTVTFLRKIAAAKEYAGIFGTEVAPVPESTCGIILLAQVLVSNIILSAHLYASSGPRWRC